MRRYIEGFVALALSCTAVVGVAPLALGKTNHTVSHAKATAPADQVRAEFNRLIDAYNHRDRRAIERIVAPDFKGIVPGGILTRPDYIKSLVVDSPGRPVLVPHIASITVKGNSAELAYWVVTADDVMRETWVKRGAHWQLQQQRLI